MKYNEKLWNLLNKYTNWAKMDWSCLVYNNLHDKMYVYDFEDRKVRSISYLIKCVFDNGMLEECFTQDEMQEFKENIPKRFKEWI